MKYEYDSWENCTSQMKREQFFSVSHFAIPLPTVNCQLSTVNWIHTFSAKEKDTETGLSVTSLRSVSSSSLSQAQTSLPWRSLIRRFGARYYSSDLSIWLSVDPMSDKYPSLSPYTYCANNPVKLVDPNGKDWFENELTGDVYYSKDYRKGDEKLIDGEGWKWMGENDMFGKTADEVINTPIYIDKQMGPFCRKSTWTEIRQYNYSTSTSARYKDLCKQMTPIVMEILKDFVQVKYGK